MPYTSDIIRYLMYYNSYGDQAGAKELFAQIPLRIRQSLQDIDYSLAEARCPQRLAIGSIIRQAVARLA
jgi:hypothetical protein